MRPALPRWLAIAAAGVLALPARAMAADVASLTIVDPPQTVAPGSAHAVTVIARNVGTETWSARGDVQIAYRVRDAADRVVLFEGARSQLPRAVSPGDDVTLCARMTAPDVPGEYRIEWDVVREGAGWFGDRQRAQRALERLVVRPRSDRAFTARVAAWMGITIAHVWLSAVWVGRARRRPDAAPSDPDEQFFILALVTLASFVAVLTVVVSAGLMSVTSVAGILAAVHMAAARITRPRESVRPVATAAISWGDRLGIVAIVTLAIQWVLGDALSLAVAGTDAAHYHVPHALNFALGAGPFGLPATGHLYPMGTSVVAAWFILPFGDPFLVDTTILPYCLLLIAALGWLFRLVTGVSGLAIVPWLALAAVQVPLVRLSTMLSADLPFAAAFVALLAALLALTHGDRPGAGGFLLATAAAGLLVGSKTTGVPTAVLLVATATALSLPSIVRTATGWRRALVLTAACFVVAFATGGVWLVRNWLNYRSPLAPMGLQVLGYSLFPGVSFEVMSHYLSELKEIEQDGAWRSWLFTRRYLQQWVGGWWLYAIWPLVMVLADLALAAPRERGLFARRRLALAIYVVLAGGVLIALVICAPWSGLRWSNGRALRYVLPVLLLVPFLASLAAFPLTWKWFERRHAMEAASLALCGITILISVSARRYAAANDAQPLVDVTAAAACLAVVLVLSWWAVRACAPPRVALVLGSAALAGAALVGARLLEDRDHVLRGRLLAGLPAYGTCGVSARAPETLGPRGLILRQERVDRRTCDTRRVFMAARFDAPLDLEGMPYDTVMLQASGATLFDSAMRVRGPGSTRCDYIVASAAELATDRGVPSLKRLPPDTTLEPINDEGPLRVFYVRPKRSVVPSY